MLGERLEQGQLSMSIETKHINRLAALNLSGDAYREVLAIISEIASVDEARRERQRGRKDRWRRKQESCPVTVTGQARDKECESHVTEARTVTGQGRDKSPRTPKKERNPSVPTEPQAQAAPSEESEEMGYFRRGKQNPWPRCRRSPEQASEAQGRQLCPGARGSRDGFDQGKSARIRRQNYRR